MQKIRELEQRWALFSISIFYGISRLGFALLGIQFGMGNFTFDQYNQYLGTEWLRHDLLRHLFYLHMEPPLYNLFLGIGLKLFHNAFPFFHVVYWLLGLVFHLALFQIFIRSGLKRSWAWVLLIIYSLNPTLVLYENWLFYGFPEAFLLLLCGFFLIRFDDSDFQSTRALVGYCLCASVLILIRSMYHPLWALGLAGVILAVIFRFQGRVRKQHVALVVIPPILGFSLMFKNYLLVGEFGTSSFFGMNISNIVYRGLTKDEVQALYKNGEVSRYFLTLPFSPLSDYNVGPLEHPTGEPTMDSPIKPEGAPNMNSIQYVMISKLNKHDAWAAIRHYPEKYLHQIQEAFTIFFWPASRYVFLDNNRQHVLAFDKAYKAMVWIGKDSYYIIFFYFLTLLASMYYALKAYVTKERDRKPILFFCYLAFALAWAVLIGTMFEIGENSRFRYSVDALYFSGLIFFIQIWYAWYKSKRQASVH